jgi:uncharacterized lipoprotein YajG
MIKTTKISKRMCCMMKKRIWILLVLLALLAGCAKPQVPVDPDT